tara:strand:+ start:133 stop:426 length:294 start_codon:yes stop_codon:yes gene_type:complete
MQQIIEADFSVTCSAMWEPKLLDNWPEDENGRLLTLDDAAEWFIKWGVLCVAWKDQGTWIEYEPTSAETGDADLKYPDRVYRSGKEIVNGGHGVEEV